MNYDDLVRKLRDPREARIFVLAAQGLEAADAIESLKKDAMRYRWLRESSNQGYEIILQGEALDKHIDEAMQHEA